MSKAQRYINDFDESLKRVEIQSSRIIDNDLIELAFEHESTFEAINKEHQGETRTPEDNSVFKAISRFLDFRTNPKASLSRVDLRNLSFALNIQYSNKKSILGNDTLTKEALSVLSQNWNDRYLFGLIRSLLFSWKMNFDGLEQLQVFVFKRLKDYKGSSKKLLLFKTNAKFFKDGFGPSLLAKQAFSNHFSIDQLTRVLKLEDTDLQYSFFQDAILEHLKKSGEPNLNFIKQLANALRLHQNDTTNKIALSKLIIKVDQNPYLSASIQDFIKDLAVELIGDPDKGYLWSPPSSKDNQLASDIEKGRKILLKWITRRFIDAFFENCINDPARKKFWMQMVDHINDFWVAGSYNTLRYKLEGDSRIDDLLDSRYQVVSGSSDVSALFMRIKE